MKKTRFTAKSESQGKSHESNGDFDVCVVLPDLSSSLTFSLPSGDEGVRKGFECNQD